MQITVGSLFTGIGGLDLAFEQAGAVCKWQVEKDKFARRALERHWPNVQRYEDATDLCYEELERVHIMVGGDPCPVRSKARSGRATTHADLAPYFLETVRHLRPIWVCRENVPSSDVHQFAFCLERFGYSTVVLAVDSANVTGQSRPRQVIIGVLASRGICPAEIFSFGKSSERGTAPVEEEQAHASCLTTRFKQYSSFDSYIAEPGRGLRVFTAIERARLQGFPDDWLAGFSEDRAATLYGNAVTVPVFRQLAERIMRV